MAGATGIALTIGLNNVGDFYQGGAPTLHGCHNDARAIAVAIAAKQGFGTPTVLLDDQATVEAVTEAITAAAAKLGPGDIFLIHYSGHGMKATSRRDARRLGNFSSCWCLFDQPLLNHDLYKLWFQFKNSVRIVVLSDSCHSGSATREIINLALKRDLDTPVVAHRDVPRMPRHIPVPRGLPLSSQQQIIAANPAFFDAARKRVAATRGLDDAADPSAAVLLLSGCLDEQTSGDLPENGLFTGPVLQTWADGAFDGSFQHLPRPGQEGDLRRQRRGANAQAVPRRQPGRARQPGSGPPLHDRLTRSGPADPPGPPPRRPSQETPAMNVPRRFRPLAAPSPWRPSWPWAGPRASRLRARRAALVESPDGRGSTR